MAGAHRGAEVQVGLERQQALGGSLPPVAERSTSKGAAHIASAAAPFQAAAPRIAAAALTSGTAHIVSRIQRFKAALAVGGKSASIHMRRTVSPSGPRARRRNPS